MAAIVTRSRVAPSGNPYERAAEHLTAAIRTPTIMHPAFDAAWRILEPQYRIVALAMTRGDHHLADDAVSLAAIKLWTTTSKPPASVRDTQEIGPGLLRNLIHNATVTALDKATTLVDRYGATRYAASHVDDEWRDNRGTILDPGDMPGRVDSTESDFRITLEQLARVAESEAYGKPMWAGIIRLVADGYTDWPSIASRLEIPNGTIRRNVKELRESGLLDPIHIATQATGMTQAIEFLELVQMELFAA